MRKILSLLREKIKVGEKLCWRPTSGGTLSKLVAELSVLLMVISRGLGGGGSSSSSSWSKMSGLGMTGGTSVWSPLAWNMRQEQVNKKRRGGEPKGNIEERSLIQSLQGFSKKGSEIRSHMRKAGVWKRPSREGCQVRSPERDLTLIVLA
jgi:hypothetical protein